MGIYTAFCYFFCFLEATNTVVSVSVYICHHLQDKHSISFLTVPDQ